MALPTPKIGDTWIIVSNYGRTRTLAQVVKCGKAKVTLKPEGRVGEYEYSLRTGGRWGADAVHFHYGRSRVRPPRDGELEQIMVEPRQRIAADKVVAILDRLSLLMREHYKDLPPDRTEALAVSLNQTLKQYEVQL